MEGGLKAHACQTSGVTGILILIPASVLSAGSSILHHGRSALLVTNVREDRYRIIFCEYPQPARDVLCKSAAYG